MRPAESKGRLPIQVQIPCRFSRLLSNPFDLRPRTLYNKFYEVLASPPRLTYQPDPFR